ncbi:MAG: glycosyltransferase family 9 protein [Candidatus Eisenbacteria bacterium]|uniref:Glycosyltransferase family 9 protein n=1 Tax=Eiseniibacteriota bacterium TaxID=2212470 RepID=A0A849SHP0_UNCEI|nr:glycosyltransferase family 9 protein [Candidatus Eisenbacteria bacterium]
MTAVLAIRLRALGDVVLTIPALRALHLGHGAPVDVVTDPRYVELVEDLPYVRRVFALGRGSFDTLRLIATLRRERYAVAVDFFGNPRSAWLTAGARASTTAGYNLRGRGFAYRIRVAREQSPGPGRREYAAHVHRRLALAAGGRDDGLDARLTPTTAALAAADRMLASAGVRDPAHAIALVAAGTWATKTWPIAHAALLARRLVSAGREVVLIEGPGEERLAAWLTTNAPGVVRLPRCGIRELTAVIARLSALVGTDSGPRHLAAALGRPTYTWFGPTHPDTWTAPDPRHGFWQTSLPCRACDRTRCVHWSCLPALDPAIAAAHVLAHLEAFGGNPADFGPAARA